MLLLLIARGSRNETKKDPGRELFWITSLTAGETSDIMSVSGRLVSLSLRREVGLMETMPVVLEVIALLMTAFSIGYALGSNHKK